MPINPYLLNQAAKGTPSPISSFLPAFQQAQDRQLKQDLLQEERGMRLAKMKQDWTEYVQEQKDRASAEENKAAFQSEISGLDPSNPGDYNTIASAASKYGQDMPSYLKPKTGTEADDVATFQVGSDIVQAVVGTKDYNELVRNPDAILRNKPSGSEFNKEPDVPKQVPHSHARLSDGRQVPLVQTPDGYRMVDNRGGYSPIPDGAEIVAGSISGTSGDFSSTKAQEGFQDRQIDTMNYVGMVGDALELLTNEPDVNTWAARGAALVNDLQQEAKTLGETLGVDIPDGVFDVEGYQNTFDELGIQNARMKSLVVSIAAQKAIANNPGGRISDKDMDIAIREIGADSKDPRAFKQVLFDSAKRSVRTLRNEYKVKTGKELNEDFGIGRLEGYLDKQGTKPKDAIDKKLFRNTKTGEEVEFWIDSTGKRLEPVQ